MALLRCPLIPRFAPGTTTTLPRTRRHRRRCSPPPASQRDEARVVALPSPMRAVHAVPGPNPANDNSAVVVAFQVRGER